MEDEGVERTAGLAHFDDAKSKDRCPACYRIESNVG